MSLLLFRRLFYILIFFKESSFRIFGVSKWKIFTKMRWLISFKLLRKILKIRARDANENFHLHIPCEDIWDWGIVARKKVTLQTKVLQVYVWSAKNANENIHLRISCEGMWDWRFVGRKKIMLQKKDLQGLRIHNKTKNAWMLNP